MEGDILDVVQRATDVALRPSTLVLVPIGWRVSFPHDLAVDAELLGPIRAGAAIATKAKIIGVALGPEDAVAIALGPAIQKYGMRSRDIGKLPIAAEMAVNTSDMVATPAIPHRMTFYCITEKVAWRILRGLQRATHLPERGYAAAVLGALKEFIDLMGTYPYRELYVLSSWRQEEIATSQEVPT